MKPLLIVKAGQTLPEIAARRGDFEDWIIAGLALPGAPIEVRAVWQGEALPREDAVSGVVVTGSSAMVSHRGAWSERAAEWLAGAVDAGTPTLGICFGHQLLAHALGGDVGPNPRGREIGTVRVALEADGDALLGSMPSQLTVHTSHIESVLRLPDGAVLLGANAVDPHHAARMGEMAWGVQFHPEFDADVVRGYVAGRREVIAAEGLDPDAITRGCVDSPHGSAILGRFGEIVCARVEED